MSIKRLLIANRGEIACRIIDSCRKLGITTIAVYSDADDGARHTRLADEAWYLGPAAAIESYLNIPALISLAKQANADAVHPGYGFLSENAEFAQACENAGLNWLGPSPAVISDMGDKSTARQRMASHQVPVLPGYDGEQQSDQQLLSQAQQIGFPLLIKPALGGGGKGMSRVDSLDQLPQALSSARRTAQAAFNNDKLLLERFLPSARHIEVQILGDKHGTVIALGERDCSIQRRHQKVVEEAPAPGLSDEQRREVHRAAIRAGQAVDYVGAGTVEFLFDGTQFYFMEMNTRLQVEHPVTEMITGQDLVAWQCQIAQGEALPAELEQLPIHGHAIEVRLYAEDPARDFLPSSGQLSLFAIPIIDGIRLDTGFEQGDVITAYYDPMLAKLIAWGEDRQQAIERLLQALAQSEISGVTTNVAFLHQLISQSEVRSGEFDINWLEQALPFTEIEPGKTEETYRIAQACALLYRWLNADDFWQSGWRLNQPTSYACLVAGELLTATKFTANYVIAGQDWTLSLAARLSGSQQLQIRQDKTESKIPAPWHTVTCSVRADAMQITGYWGSYLLSLTQDETAQAKQQTEKTEQAQSQEKLLAPLHGNVYQVLCQAGDIVKPDQPLVILEAMKMEHTLCAPAALQIKRVCCQPGEQIEEDQVLVEFTPTDDSFDQDNQKGKHKHAAIGS